MSLVSALAAASASSAPAAGSAALIVSSGGWLDWLVFIGLIVGTSLLDTLIFGRGSHHVSFREAATRSVVWIGIACVFAGWILLRHGYDTAAQFTIAYVVEKSLSVDNLFVFLLIFSHFRVPQSHQHPILVWGVFGAVVMRAVFIVAGAALLHQFHFLLYLFGAFLIWSGVKLLFSKDDDEDDDEGYENSTVVALSRRFIPTTDKLDGNRFFTRVNGRLVGTPLLLVLVVVELSDLVFAVDSVPAVLAISQDLFVVYTSNILAILGLRSLFFMLSGAMGKFHYLKLALAFILTFIGVKMVVDAWVHIPNVVSLAVIMLALAAAVVASVLRPKVPAPPAPNQAGHR